MEAGAGVRGREVTALRILALLLGATQVHAGGPPAHTERPEFYAHVLYMTPGGTRVEVRGRVQYARGDSLDLERLAPASARLPRVEAYVASEAVVLHAHRPDPERYRVAVPRGAPLAWETPLDLGKADSLPHAVGPDWACVWLGSLVLAPRLPDDSTAAVERIFLGTNLPDRWRALGPWPRRAKLFWPASLDDLVDDYLAVGAGWRVREHVLGTEAAACTLQVAVAGKHDDAAWNARLAAWLAPQLPTAGRALVCVAPTGGAPQVWRGRRSWLVLWPEAAPPPDHLGTARRPGRRPA